MNRAYVVSVARTVISPKGGVHQGTPLQALAAPALQAAWQGVTQVAATCRAPDFVVLGNACAAGGNPARLCSLTTFGPEVPAITIDTQCCSGLDALGVAFSLVRSGQASIVIAGGVESASQAPLRARIDASGPVFYEQAQFTPWLDRDPNVLQAAQSFASQHGITRQAQEAWAIRSHAKALAAQRGKLPDSFTRHLDERTCARARPLIDASPCALTACTVAPLADAAAVLVVVNEHWSRYFDTAIEMVDYQAVGVDPIRPAQGGAQAAQALISRLPSQDQSRIRCLELMESFAAQVINDVQVLGLPRNRVNRWGGMLAKGHPIGASGAILAGNLALQLREEPRGALGIAAIPAAGGLGSAVMLRKS